MLFSLNSILALSGVFMGVAFANPEPQTPAQTTEAAAELVSYYEALETDPALLSIASVLETDPAAVKTLQVFATSLMSQIESGQTPAANFLDGLPTEARSFFGSVYTAGASIASKNGFTPQATGAATGSAGAESTSPSAGSATSTQSGSPAAPTCVAMGLTAGALAGFVGVILAL